MLLSGVDSVPLLQLQSPDAFAVFCFFNLIIAFLLVSSTAASRSAPPPENPAAEDEPPVDGGAVAGESCRSGDAGDERVVFNAARSPEEGEPVDMSCAAAGESPSPAEEDDELNRRVEAFIVKMNRVWMAEREETRRSPSIILLGGELGQ